MDTTDKIHQWKQTEMFLTDQIVCGKLKELISLRKEYQNDKSNVFAQNKFIEAQKEFLNSARRQGVYEQIEALLNHVDSTERLGELLK